MTEFIIQECTNCVLHRPQDWWLGSPCTRLQCFVDEDVFVLRNQGSPHWSGQCAINGSTQRRSDNYKRRSIARMDIIIARRVLRWILVHHIWSSVASVVGGSRGTRMVISGHRSKPTIELFLKELWYHHKKIRRRKMEYNWMSIASLIFESGTIVYIRTKWAHNMLDSSIHLNISKGNFSRLIRGYFGNQLD